MWCASRRSPTRGGYDIGQSRERRCPDFPVLRPALICSFGAEGREQARLTTPWPVASGASRRWANQCAAYRSAARCNRMTRGAVRDQLRRVMPAAARIRSMTESASTGPLVSISITGQPPATGRATSSFHNFPLARSASK